MSVPVIAPTTEAEAIAFLRAVLPPEPHWMAVSMKPKRTAAARADIDEEFVTSAEQLWQLSAAADQERRDAYFATASFIEPDFDDPGTPKYLKRLGRNTPNAGELRALRIDLDTATGMRAKGKPGYKEQLYVDVPTALTADAGMNHSQKIRCGTQALVFLFVGASHGHNSATRRFL